jgi:hypothetical protein
MFCSTKIKTQWDQGQSKKQAQVLFVLCHQKLNNLFRQRCTGNCCTDLLIRYYSGLSNLNLIMNSGDGSSSHRSPRSSLALNISPLPHTTSHSLSPQPGHQVENGTREWAGVCARFPRIVIGSGLAKPIIGILSRAIYDVVSANSNRVIRLSCRFNNKSLVASEPSK